MELVYLWVKEYKNIQEQGFNFSPRFKCDFDGENLTIEEDEDYISIFPDNINITSIVGRNGTGKSNLLELVGNNGYENPLKNSYPISILDMTKITIYYDRVENKFYIDKKNINITIKNKSLIIHEEKTCESIQKILIRPTPSHNQKEYLLLLNFLVNNQEIHFPFNIPQIIDFGVHDDSYDLLNLIENKEFDFHSHYSPFNEDETKRFKIFHILLLLAHLKNYNIDFKIESSKDYDVTISKLENKINRSFKSKISKFIQVIKNNLEKFSNNPNHYVNLKNIPKDFFEIYIEIIKRKNGDNLLDFKGKKVFIFNLFPKMSDGQYQFTYLFNMIYSNINKENILLRVDECDNNMHPNWQKQYISYILKFIKDNFSAKNIHIILTTHSPFLLSDIPKQNLIFLDTDKDHKCKVIDVNIDTFGTNIHTLLSHGFFMQDGLMGEFAKGKIEEIKKFYELVKFFEMNIKENKKPYIYVKLIYILKIKKFRHIKSIIGEPFLQNVIKNYLDELEIIFNGKKQFLQDEIKRLQELESSL